MNQKEFNKINNCDWKKDDDYETNEYTWEKILKFIPKELVIWQPFFCTGKSKTIVENLGYKVIHENKDFFEWEPDNYDIIIDNPPFSIKKKVIERLITLKKPWVLLLPFNVMKCVYFQKLLVSILRIIPLDQHKTNFYKNGKLYNKPGATCFLVPWWFGYNCDKYLPQIFN